MPKGKFFQGTALVLLAALVLASCATYATPRVGAYHSTKTMEQVAADETACISFARGRAGDPAGAAAQEGAVGALGGAAAGAAAGAIGGAIAGRPGMGAGYGAAAGALLGILGGIASGTARTDQAFNNAYAACMAAKGYTVAR